MHFWDDFGFNKNLSQGEKWFLETLTIEKFEKRKQTIYSVKNSIFSADIDVDIFGILVDVDVVVASTSFREAVP